MANNGKAPKHAGGQQQHAAHRPVLGEYFALDFLWSENQNVPIFTSEASARWFVRNNRKELTAQKAVAIHAGRMLVHPKRFAEVAELVALRNAASRVESHGA